MFLFGAGRAREDVLGQETPDLECALLWMYCGDVLASIICYQCYGGAGPSRRPHVSDSQVLILDMDGSPVCRAGSHASVTGKMTELCSRKNGDGDCASGTIYEEVCRI